MHTWYTLVMDDRINPLRELQKPRRFQLMTLLSFMWTVLFCFALGAWLWFDELMIAHLAVLVGIAFTGMIFYGTDGDAPARARAKTSREGRR